MTREEAIKGLETLSKSFSGYKPNEEMFTMAISALKAQMDGDTISKQDAIDVIQAWKRFETVEGLVDRINRLPSAQPPCNELATDTISRRAAIDALMEILDRPNHAEFLYTDEICRALGQLPPAQPEEDCDTCKHGYFGDDQCNNCRVRYPSHYERRTDE